MRICNFLYSCIDFYVKICYNKKENYDIETDRVNFINVYKFPIIRKGNNKVKY